MDRFNRLQATERQCREANRAQVWEMTLLTTASKPCVAYGFPVCPDCKRFEAQADTETTLRQALTRSTAEWRDAYSASGAHSYRNSREYLEICGKVRWLEWYLVPQHAQRKLAADKADLR